VRIDDNTTTRNITNSSPADFRQSMISSTHTYPGSRSGANMPAASVELSLGNHNGELESGVSSSVSTHYTPRAKKPLVITDKHGNPIDFGQQRATGPGVSGSAVPAHGVQARKPLVGITDKHGPAIFPKSATDIGVLDFAVPPFFMMDKHGNTIDIGGADSNSVDWSAVRIITRDKGGTYFLDQQVSVPAAMNKSNESVDIAYQHTPRAKKPLVITDKHGNTIDLGQNIKRVSRACERGVAQNTPCDTRSLVMTDKAGNSIIDLSGENGEGEGYKMAGWFKEELTLDGWLIANASEGRI
jgi:hypothetical protein